ncbi:MAG: phosphoglucosamine mutase [Bacteroidales bacterium]|nr:phosphoglucosamine mutase [Bacteroidales bacterium]
MTLIKSISGIRGTIGGTVGKSLTPIDIVKFTSAFATMTKTTLAKNDIKFVIGRDARVSGIMVNHLVIGTLMGMGVNVVDMGLSTTPTVELAVTDLKADGGIILTASHNPKQWNALKLLNNKGEFISAAEGAQVLEIAKNEAFNYAIVDKLGHYAQDNTYLEKHIQMILNLPLVNVEAIKKAGFKVVIDCVNSTGGLVLPKLLKALGVVKVYELYCEPTGIFSHNPEPLPENLSEISEKTEKSDANLGFVVDPDVDRLAIICENGEMFGEEYTLVAVADYILKHKTGNTVSNLSSTKALKDITLKAGGQYSASAVGEVNVVEMMKETNAVIGGEGNGGIIYPDLHYGRDALVGIALFLSHLATYGKSCSMLKKEYPQYYISKNKIELDPDVKTDKILSKMTELYSHQPHNTIDGVKIEFGSDWVHLRSSNTEPIIRIYAECQTESTAEALAKKIIDDIRQIIKDI